MANDLTLQLRINANGTAAITALNGVQQELRQTGAAARTAETETSRLISSMRGLAMTAAGGLAVGAAFTAMGRGIITAGIEAQKMEKALTAIAGSSTAAAAEMAYVQATADKLGLKVGDAASAYISLTAAAKGTTLEGKASKDIFEAISLAMGKLGKSSADTQGALLAVEQMISKGKVSAEELRGQLGERLPGAFQAAAKAMGVTTAELDGMLSKGEVLAEDLLPLLAQHLNTLYDDGKKVGGLEAEWSRLVNAMNNLGAATDSATGATSRLGEILSWATGKANAFGEALGVISRWQEGKGFAYGDRDALASDFALRAKLLDEYVVKMKDAQAYLNENDLDNSAARRAEGEALIARINEIDARTKTALEDVKAARAEAEDAAARTAADMNNGAVKLYQEHSAAITKNGEDLDKLSGKYDKNIAKKAEYAKMEAAVAEAVKLGSMTQAEATAKLEAFAASQDKATASSRAHGKALSEEAQIVASVEQKYGLYKGQLDAVWKLESSRGKGAGTDSVRWVKDLAAGEGHMTKIVGQFQMAESTAKGLGANMKTFNGQADAAGKYMAEAAAKGKTLWEQFAYYHGGPNEKAWGEKTRAYADAAVKIVADATGSMQDLGQNTGKVITDTLNAATRTVDGLISRYLPARAATEEFEQAQLALAAAADLVGLSQEEQAIILQGLQKDLDNATQKSRQSADAMAEVWKNAVKRIDDTFANLWKDLFSGTKTTLESMKDAVLSWLAEVAHALITKPLVVAITTGMVGGTGVAGAATSAASSASGLSGLSNIGSLASNIFSLGSTFVSGVYEGLMGMFSTNMFSTLGSAWGAATSGSATGAAAGMGVMAAYALPLIAIAAPIIGKYFSDQEPRTGAYAATTNGNLSLLEDEVGAKGGFGLTFGMNDLGTANVDAEEMRQTFEGFAAVSQALADFYGKDVESKVQASLADAAAGNWGKNGLMNYAMNAEQAFGMAFADIIKHAAATGDDLAVVMASVVGGLSGTLEDMANQIERGMQASKAALGMAEALQGQALGDSLEMQGSLVANALKLVDYANQTLKAGETTAEALARMTLNIAVFDQAMTLTGTTTEATGLAFIALASQLADAADQAKIGMQGLAQLQGVYAKEFLGPLFIFEQQIQAAQHSIDIAFKDLAGSIQMPGTREAFIGLIESIDLTTESGRALYIEMMKLGPAFDLLFDAQEAFTDWLDPIDPLKKALTELGAVFGKWGLTLPKSRDELLELYRSGKLTTEQMAILGSHLDALKLLFPELTAGIDAAGQAIVDLTDLHIRLAQALGDEGAALWYQRQQELANAGDDASRAMLLMIYAADDLARKFQAAGEEAPKNFNTELLKELARLMGRGYTNFDPDGNDLVTVMELLTALGPLADDPERTALMDRLDKDNDGLISVLEKLPLLIAANLAPLFDRFDADNNGSLSRAELAKALAGVVDGEQLAAIYDLLDVNGDGLVDKLEAVRLSLYTSLRDVVSAVDTSKDGQLSREELTKVLGKQGESEATQAWLAKVYAMLDTNNDGLLNALEALPLSIASGLEANFNLLDTSGDAQLSLEELKAAYGDMASDQQLRDLIALSDANGDGQISAQEAGNLKLDLLALKADKISDVVNAITFETTQLSGDLNAINATLLTQGAPAGTLDIPQNLIQNEAGDGAALRAALAELQAELQALRASQQSNATSQQSAAQSMQQATANLGAAVAAIPDRIDILMPQLASEAGY